MNEEKFLAARAANLEAAAVTNEQQPACTRTELAFRHLTDRSIRALHGESEAGKRRFRVWGVIMESFQAQGSLLESVE